MHGAQCGRDALLPRQDRQQCVAQIRSRGGGRGQAGRRVADGLLGFPGHRDVVPLGVVEHGHEVARVADEDAGVGHVQRPIDDADARADVAAARTLPEVDEPRRRDAALEHPRGELVDRGDVPVVGAHEVGRVREPERGGESVLMLEAQQVVFRAFHKVEPVADPPQEVAGRVHVGQAGFRHDAFDDQVPQVGELEFDLGQPPGRMQVAQPAAAVLDVGLQQIERVAVLRVAGAALPSLGLEERGAALADHVAFDRGTELLGQGRIPADEPAVQQRGADLEVAVRVPQALADVPHRVADLPACVHQAVVQALPDRLRVRGDLPVVQEQQVDVRVRAQFPTPVAAQREDAAALAQAHVAARVQAGRRGEDVFHEAVHERRMQMHDGPSAVPRGVPLGQHPPDFFPVALGGPAQVPVRVDGRLGIRGGQRRKLRRTGRGGRHGGRVSARPTRCPAPVGPDG